jgi:truncated hemoglobin YjbI
MKRTAIAFAAVVLSAAGPAAAQVAIEANDTPLSAVISQIAEQTGQRIVAAPDAAGSVTCKLTSRSAEEALSVLCTTMGLECKKVYLPLAAGETVGGAELSEIVSALEQVQRSGVVVEDSEKGTSLVFSRDGSPPEKVTDGAYGGNEPYRLVYLVRPVRAHNVPKTQTAKIDDLVRQDMERAMASSTLSPADQDRLARRYADMFFSLDPGLRNQIVMDRMRMMANMTPQERSQMRQIMSDAWQTMPDDLRKRFEQITPSDLGGEFPGR